jgi:hypothetical protein
MFPSVHHLLEDIGIFDVAHGESLQQLPVQKEQQEQEEAECSSDHADSRRRFSSMHTQTSAADTPVTFPLGILW